MKHPNLNFYHKPQKPRFSPKTLCTHIECPDIHAGFFFGIFQLFKMCIWTMGAYAPRSHCPFPRVVDPTYGTKVIN